MAKWTFEPGHTAAEFSVRHMMVTNIRGHFKNVHGTLGFDPGSPEGASVEVTIDANELWSGEADRDGHLKSEDFLDVENHPQITFKGTLSERQAPMSSPLQGSLPSRELPSQQHWTSIIWDHGKRPGGKITRIKDPRPGPASRR